MDNFHPLKHIPIFHRDWFGVNATSGQVKVINLPGSRSEVEVAVKVQDQGEPPRQAVTVLKVRAS